MGENVKVAEHSHTAEEIRQQIRDTESHITETVQSLGERLSPRSFGQREVGKAKHAMWLAAARALELVQRTAVQATVVGGSVGGSLFWILMRNRKGRKASLDLSRVRGKGTAALALGATLLEIVRKKADRGGRAAAKRTAKTSAPSPTGLAVTATKAFFKGARASAKGGTTLPGRKLAWRSIATAIGAALGSYWYSHRGHGAAR